MAAAANAAMKKSSRSAAASASASNDKNNVKKMKKGALRKAQAAAAERKQLMRRVAQQKEIETMLQSEEEDEDEDENEDDDEDDNEGEDEDVSDKDNETSDDDDDIRTRKSKTGKKDNEDNLLKVYTRPEDAGGPDNPPERRGVVYVGRIPHGFYEPQMRAYFAQFGRVTRLRISRNKKSGHSRHYGFVEFDDAEVAGVVAETMDGYLMFNHVLRCRVVPPENVHPELFKGCDRPFRPRKSSSSRAAAAASFSARSGSGACSAAQLAQLKRRHSTVARRRSTALSRLGIKYEAPAPVPAARCSTETETNTAAVPTSRAVATEMTEQ